MRKSVRIRNKLKLSFQVKSAAGCGWSVRSKCAKKSSGAQRGASCELWGAELWVDDFPSTWAPHSCGEHASLRQSERSSCAQLRGASPLRSCAALDQQLKKGRFTRFSQIFISSKCDEDVFTTAHLGNCKWQKKGVNFCHKIKKYWE